MALLAIFIVGNAIAVPYLQDNRTRNRQRNASSQQVSADGKRAAGKGANASANGGGAKGANASGKMPMARTLSPPNRFSPTRTASPIVSCTLDGLSSARSLLPSPTSIRVRST